MVGFTASPPALYPVILASVPERPVGTLLPGVPYMPDQKTSPPPQLVYTTEVSFQAAGGAAA